MTDSNPIDSPLPLDRESAAILDVLARHSLALRQAEIAAVVDLSRATVRMRMLRLRSAGLIDKPNGPRSGYAVTDDGRKRLSALPSDVLAAWGLAR